MVLVSMLDAQCFDELVRSELREVAHWELVRDTRYRCYRVPERVFTLGSY